MYELDGAVWRIKQIKNGLRLFEEGSHMHHCVLCYKDVCVRGEVSIWSLTRAMEGRVHRCLTIEVVIHSRLILQCRGFANRPPSEQERVIVRRWALEHQLLWPTDLQ